MKLAYFYASFCRFRGIGEEIFFRGDGFLARPKKTGLDYFPRDVDIWDDCKIMDLVDHYGPRGFCIYDVILSEVYRNGYFLEIKPDRLAMMIIRKVGVAWLKNKNFVLQVIHYCAELGLIDNALLSRNVITSAGIQKRYCVITARNKVDKSKYWLLDDEAAALAAPENFVSVTETPVSAAKTPVSAAEMPTKERKENKNKLNKSCGGSAAQSRRCRAEGSEYYNSGRSSLDIDSLSRFGLFYDNDEDP